MTSRQEAAQATRRLILDSAGRLLAERGTEVSLQQIADEAGISKSGLLHHFASRDEVFHAVVVDMVAQFRAKVMARIRIDEPAQGRLLRAYLRALLAGDPTVNGLYGPALYWTGLGANPEIRAALDSDEQWWRQQSEADGLDPVTTIIVEYAADGIAAAMALGHLSVEDVQPALNRLIEMTEESQDKNQ